MSSKTEYPFTITNDSVTVTIEGEPYTIRKGTVKYAEARAAVLEGRWDEVPTLFVPGHAIEDWLDGLFTYEDGKLRYNGDDLPESLANRILTTAAHQDDPTNLLAFWEKLQENPSYRSVQQLWSFLSHQGIPIDDEGYILAYKGVRADYMDKWSGTIDNSPGSLVEYERNKVSDDPKDACAEGLHAGDESYARGWAGSEGKLVIVRIHPRDVVSIPEDSGCRKMRCCRYEVLGLAPTGRLPDTTYTEDEEDEVEPLVDDFDGTVVECEHTDADDVPTTDDNGRWTEQPHRWSYLDDAAAGELWEESLRTLRRYARHTLKIIGASKMRGGKEALIDRIVEVRGY